MSIALFFRTLGFTINNWFIYLWKSMTSLFTKNNDTIVNNTDNNKVISFTESANTEFINAMNNDVSNDVVSNNHNCDLSSQLTNKQYTIQETNIDDAIRHRELTTSEILFSLQVYEYDDQNDNKNEHHDFDFIELDKFE